MFPKNYQILTPNQPTSTNNNDRQNFVNPKKSECWKYSQSGIWGVLGPQTGDQNQSNGWHDLLPVRGTVHSWRITDIEFALLAPISVFKSETSLFRGEDLGMNPNHTTPHYLGSTGPNLNLLDNMLMAAGFQVEDLSPWDLTQRFCIPKITGDWST